MWDTRYSGDEYFYGVEPNEFLVEVVDQIPKGRVLSLAEGEGRNAVYLATKGYDVTGVDSSRVGLEKAQKLASKRSVQITTTVADLADFQIEPESWEGIISFFCHLPPTLRATVHQGVVAGLRPGGVFILEAFTPRQLAYKTGGPSQIDLLMDVETLQEELTGLHFERAVEIERDFIEGNGHHGPGAVVQILAVK